jgi:hypothetical protein
MLQALSTTVCSSHQPLHELNSTLLAHTAWHAVHCTCSHVARVAADMPTSRWEVTCGSTCTTQNGSQSDTQVQTCPHTPCNAPNPCIRATCCLRDPVENIRDNMHTLVLSLVHKGFVAHCTLLVGMYILLLYWKAHHVLAVQASTRDLHTYGSQMTGQAREGMCHAACLLQLSKHCMAQSSCQNSTLEQQMIQTPHQPAVLKLKPTMSSDSHFSVTVLLLQHIRSCAPARYKM